MNATVTNRQQSIAFGSIQVVLTTEEKNHIPIRKGRDSLLSYLAISPAKLNISLTIRERVGGKKKKISYMHRRGFIGHSSYGQLWTQGSVLGGNHSGTQGTFLGHCTYIFISNKGHQLEVDSVGWETGKGCSLAHGREQSSDLQPYFQVKRSKDDCKGNPNK